MPNRVFQGRGASNHPSMDHGKKSCLTKNSISSNNSNIHMYPLPAHLHFVPGGLEYSNPKEIRDSKLSSHKSDHRKHCYVLRDLKNPDDLVKDAFMADNILRSYTLLYAYDEEETKDGRVGKKEMVQHAKSEEKDEKETKVPYFLPSLSMLAETAFAPLTGVEPSSVRLWADAMVLAYMDNGHDDDDNIKYRHNEDIRIMKKWQSYCESNSTKKSSHHSNSHTSKKTPPSLIATLKHLKEEHNKKILNSQNSSDGAPLHVLPRRPCGYVFRSGDIAWNCRTCQSDSTCVICDECFHKSDHEGHEVFFHRTSQGGCCDCGDIEAWAVNGCCPVHRPIVPSKHNSATSNISPSCVMIENSGDEGIDDVASTGTHSSCDLLSLDMDSDEAVKSSLRGREEADLTIRSMFPPRFAAALGTIIGAAVNATVIAVDGSGISSDIVQWTKRWADQVRCIIDGRAVEEEYHLYMDGEDPTWRDRKDRCFSVDKAMQVPFPPGFALELRLHNDDVHTYDEVSRALFRKRSHLLGMDVSNNNIDNRNSNNVTDNDNVTDNNNNNNNNGANTNLSSDNRNPASHTTPSTNNTNSINLANETNTEYGLVGSREEAETLTKEVDMDGESYIRTYRSFDGALAGFHHLKSVGLHVSVASTPQVKMESRAQELITWLSDVAAAHPAAAALVVHALVDVVEGQDEIGGVHVWNNGRSLPPWSFPDFEGASGNGDVTSLSLPGWRRRMKSFPPHLLSSYLSREASVCLFHFGVSGNKNSNDGKGNGGRNNSVVGDVTEQYCSPEEFMNFTGIDTNASFYKQVPYRLPSERYRKSPHALWGTMPSPIRTHNKPFHPSLFRQDKHNACDKNRSLVTQNLLDSLYILDTDLRKQQEANMLITSPYPHKLLGLHMVSGVGLAKASNNQTSYDVTAIQNKSTTAMDWRQSQTNLKKTDSTIGNDESANKSLIGESVAASAGATDPPTAADWRRILSISSFRAPVSPILILLLLDPYPTKKLRDTLHLLFLPLLVDYRFKSRFAASLGGVAYRPLSTLFCAGVGTDASTSLQFTVQIFTAGSMIRAMCNGEITKKLLSYDGLSQKDKNNEFYEKENKSKFEFVFTMPLAHNIVRCIHTNLLGTTEEVRMVLKNTAAGNEKDGHKSSELMPSQYPALIYQEREHPLTTLLPAASDDGFLDHRSTRHKRLNHLLRDLEYVFESPGTALRLLLTSSSSLSSISSVSNNEYLGVATKTPNPIDFLSFPTVWSRLLRLTQGMDLQKRKTNGGHVEYESLRWLEAFSLTLNLATARDALAETQSNPIPNIGNPSLEAIRLAMGNLFLSLIHEIKRWLYKEDLLETGFSVEAANVGHDISKIEALQRSTLHIPSMGVASGNFIVAPLALACATHIRMNESQLDRIEKALATEHTSNASYNPGDAKNSCGWGTVMGDWLRVPHFPLGGSRLSYHIPLHRALARCIRSLCSMVVSEKYRQRNIDWWNLPVLDCSGDPTPSSPSTVGDHPLISWMKPSLRSTNCEILWWNKECTAEEEKSRYSRSAQVSAAIASAKVSHSLCDHPLRCLAAAEQTARRLWARNGAASTGMALNYRNVPLCRSFRDLDMTLVQLSSSGMSVGLGPRRVFSLLLTRFGMDGYLCDPELRFLKTEAESSSSGQNIRQNYVNPPIMQDPEHAIILSEAFFCTLCVLVTELPSPPPFSRTDDNALRRNIRRELLHALASEPRTYSEAMTAASCSVTRRDESSGSSSNAGGGAALFRKVFSEVLEEIGVQKQRARRSSGTLSFELRQNFSDEYDPTFFHLNRSEHQHAMDRIARLRRQKCRGNDKNTRRSLPLVSPPPLAHPRFLPCRLLLHLSALDGAMRRALLFALTNGQWLPPQPPEAADGDTAIKGDIHQTGDDAIESALKYRRHANARRMSNNHYRLRNHSNLSKDHHPFSQNVVSQSSISFIEVLQILTLQIHTLEECAFIHRSHPNLDHDAKTLSSSISVNSYLGRLIHVPDALKDAWALQTPPNGPLPSNGSGSNRGSILGLLVALYEHRADRTSSGSSVDKVDSSGEYEEKHGGARYLVADGLKWLLRFVHSLVDGAESVGRACKCASDGIPMTFMSSQQESSTASKTMWTIDENVRKTIRGMLANLSDLWPMTSTSVNTTSSSNKGDSQQSSKINREARKAAQMRILDKMKKKQDFFAASLGGDDSMNKMGMDGNIDSEEKDLCIICKCDDDDGAESNGSLGFLGHVQRSRALQLRYQAESSNSLSSCYDLNRTYRVIGEEDCQLRASEEIDSAIITQIQPGSIVTVVDAKISPKYDILSRNVKIQHRSSEFGENILEGWVSLFSAQGNTLLSPLTKLCHNNTRWGSTRPVLKLCGHSAHSKCVETHLLSLHQQRESDTIYDGRFAANIDDGEFLCPLCKQLSNVLVPSTTRENYDGGMERASCHSIKQLSNSSFSPEKMKLIRHLLESSHSRNDDNDKKEFDATKHVAIQAYGNKLYDAMQTSSWVQPSNSKNVKQRRQWLPELTKWDYKDSQRDGTERGLADTLILLRQMHISWATLGHSAAVVEASSRGIRPQGLCPAVFDPWIDYTNASSKHNSHPMLRELRRTLSATSAFFNFVCDKLETLSKRCDQENKFGTQGERKCSLVGHLLSNIMCGIFWTSSTIGDDVSQNQHAKQWRILTSALSSMPCHLSKDETLSQQQEARAVATMIWAAKGRGKHKVPSSKSSQTNLHDPPTPFAVKNLSFSNSLDDGWGSDSFLDQSVVKEMKPFRPAIACSFLYMPLLSWDLNTFAGALFSSILSNEFALRLECLESIFYSAQILLIGRIIQVLITPTGCDKFNAEESMCVEIDLDISKEGSAIDMLRKHCLSALDDYGGDGKRFRLNGEELLTSVSLAILPFARSLFLLLRACLSEWKSKFVPPEKNSAYASKIETNLIDVLENDQEAMFVEEGFYFVLKLGCPLPSDLMNQDVTHNNSERVGSSWLNLIDCWLNAISSLESYHGSRGNHLEYNDDLKVWQKSSDDTNLKRYDSYKRKRSNKSVDQVKNIRHTAMVDIEAETEADAEQSVYEEESESDGPSMATSSEHDESSNESDHDVEMRNEQSSTSSSNDNESGSENIDPWENLAEELNAATIVRNQQENFEADDENVGNEINDDSVVEFLGGLVRTIRDEVQVADGWVEFAGNLNAATDDFDANEEMEVAEGLALQGLDSWVIDQSSNNNETDIIYNNDDASLESQAARSSSDKAFADVSNSVLIPYQPSFLGYKEPGLGPRGKYFDHSAAASDLCDLSYLGMKHSLGSQNSGLISLPKSYVELYGLVNKVKNTFTDAMDDRNNTETAICLITGAVLRTGSRRADSTPGPCTLYSRTIGSGTGIFFLLQKCTVLLMHNNKSAYSESIYLDENGEEDTSLRRGRPLFLNEERYIALETLWYKHCIPREVAQIRSTADRVIKDNWY